MASIAYITDKNMIEYHRLNGNHSINFWKPSNTKKISDFHAGDYLFFLAKGTEKGRKREKGIVGYGKFQKNYTMTFSQMWNKYGTKNGYPSKDTLEEAICKVTKNHRLPNTLHCLILEDLVFFQAPVYLSEIGVEISNKIESYLYLDRDDMMNTSRILEMANSIGVDMWSSLFHQEEHFDLIKDARLHMIQSISEKLECDRYSKHESRMLYRYATQCMKTMKDAHFIGTSKTEFLQATPTEIRVFLPCIVNTVDFKKKLQFLIGHYQMFQAYLTMREEGKDILLICLFNQGLTPEDQAVLKQLHINYEERLIADDQPE